MNRKVRKRTFGHLRPAKIQIRLRIRAVWSESSVGAFWIANDSTFLYAGSEDSDRTARMRMLIWVFYRRTCQKVRFYIIMKEINTNNATGNMVMQFTLKAQFDNIHKQNTEKCEKQRSSAMRKKCLWAFANSKDPDQGIRCLLTEAFDSVKYIDVYQRPYQISRRHFGAFPQSDQPFAVLLQKYWIILIKRPISDWGRSGPGCSKLNELVKGHFVNCFSGFNIQYSDIFCWKNVSSFCTAKATHIFSAKNIRIFAYHSM